MYLLTSSSTKTPRYFNKLHAKVLLEQSTGRQVLKKSVACYATPEVAVNKNFFLRRDTAQSTRKL
jgi:hypothetical protein